MAGIVPACKMGSTLTIYLLHIQGLKCFSVSLMIFNFKVELDIHKGGKKSIVFRIEGKMCKA